MKRMIWLCLLLLALFAPARAEDTLWVCVDGTLTEMDREAYLVGAVAAEMPASYALEALKAQAVAARTRAVAGTCASHPGADICTDSGCCQGYLDEAAQEARWGGETAYWRARIVQAVEETRGVIMTWEGRPIEVLYHAVSGGQTEDVELVYSQALPYLRSVPSPGEETASGYESVQTFSHGELVALFPEQAVEGRVALEVLERSDSGRVLWLSVGGPRHGRPHAAQRAGPEEHQFSNRRQRGYGNVFAARLWARGGHEPGRRQRHGAGRRALG